ncbi:LamG-like jellyroll fold domain-containing protein [Verrucomicrobiota bacterium]
MRTCRLAAAVGVGAVLALVQGGRADYTGEVMADNPEAYYRFEEWVGQTTLRDHTGNDHHSILLTNVTFDVEGPVGEAGEFGGNGYVVLALQLPPTATDFSIEALARFDTTDGNRHIASQQDGAVGTGRSLLYRAGNGRLRTYLGGTGSSSTTVLDEGVWNHVAMTVQRRGANTVRFYVNGAAAGTHTISLDFAIGYWVLGAAKDYGAGLIGALDEVAVYTQALSPARVAAHCRAVPAYVDITNANVTVDRAVAACSIGGNINRWMVGTMWWTNDLNGASGEFDAPDGPGFGWEVRDIALTIGVNDIEVGGTNVLGETASDVVMITRGSEHGGDSPVHYVSTNGAAVWPYTNWAAAARSIQVAVHTASAGDTVLVTNGLYDTGGPRVYDMRNRVALTKAITLRSVNTGKALIVGSGPNGPAAARCVYLTGGAVIDGFTLTNGHTHVSGHWEREQSGGGVYCAGGGTVQHCIITGNSAHEHGAGMACLSATTVRNCLIRGNSGRDNGGGVWIAGAADPVLRNCTIRGNSSVYSGGGVYTEDDSGAVLVNCIIWGNTAASGPNWRRGGESFPCYLYCCTTPVSSLPRCGTPCVEDDPMFVDEAAGDFRLRSASPCINAGTNQAWMTGATDLGGDPRISVGRVDIGAYEWRVQGEHTGPSPLHHVSTNGGALWPYTNWATAARTIQYAVEAAADGDTVLVSTGRYATGSAIAKNMNNRVALTRPITMQSVGGPEHTLIVGAADPATTNGPAAMRCAYLVDGATLSGFTLTNGHTRASGGYHDDQSGGGAALDSGGRLTDCIVVGNSAAGHGGGVLCLYGGTVADTTLSGNSAFAGGGACTVFGGTLERCTLTGNSAEADGGGMHFKEGGELLNSLLSGNSAARYGGGAYVYRLGTGQHCTLADNDAGAGGGGIYVSEDNGSALANCIVWGNEAVAGGQNWDSDATFGSWQNCCTWPEQGTHCLTVSPQFANAAAGDYRLRTNSPCIDNGTNLTGIVDDLDGTPRPLDGDANGTAIADVGCHEHLNGAADSDGDGLTDGDELFTYGTDPTDANTDDDPHNDYEEAVVAQTDATDPNDYFCITAVSNNSPVTVYFESSSGRLYTMQGCSSLVTGHWSSVTGRMGNGGPDYIQDTNAPLRGPFYRLNVQIP